MLSTSSENVSNEPIRRTLGKKTPSKSEGRLPLVHPAYSIGLNIFLNESVVLDGDRFHVGVHNRTTALWKTRNRVEKTGAEAPVVGCRDGP